MRAKEYLKQLKVAQTKIEQMSLEIANLKTVTAGIASNTSNTEKVTSSRTVEDKMAQSVTNYCDLEIDFRQKRWEYMQLRSKIISEIHELSDSRYIQILYMHYVQDKRLEEIACTMTKANGDPYSFAHINELHGEALNRFEEQILKND